MKNQATINYRWKVYVLALLFLATLFSIIFLSSVKVYAEESEGAITVSIDNHQPMVGEPLNVSVDGLPADAKLSYIWTIDGELANRQKLTYTPSEDDYEKWIMVRVYDDGELVGSDRIWFSKLPVVYINTEDGESITSKTAYKSASMRIQGNSEYGDVDMYNYDSTIQIKGRGNASWMYPSKKPYKIKLDTSTDIFGFGKNKHWVLLANYYDESLVRNTIANVIATKMGVVGMDTTWVDVIVNGEYAGNYQFCEHIRIAESRVDIFDWDGEAEDVAKAIYQANKDILTKNDRDEIEGLLTIDYSWITSGTVMCKNVEYPINVFYDYNKNISGGYLLELGYYMEKYGEREISEFYTNAGMRVIVDKPEYTVTNDAMMKYIKTYMQDYEDAICALDGYNSEDLHYTQKADFDSMVGYWLALEICGNNDAVYRSRWAYKDIDGLLTFGPVWDFDWGFGSATVGSNAAGWKLTKENYVDNFFKEWVDDPYFTIKAQEQYWEIRPYLQSIIDEGGLVDKYNEYLKESGAANESLWKWKRGYQEDTDVVRTYLKERLIWLDKQFASQESIMESLHTEYSANPYTKSDDNLIITLDNVAVDNITEDVPADGLIVKGEDLVCKVHVVDEDTTAIAVYVNGLRLDENEYIYDVVDRQCSFTIPAETFTEEAGSKNVISLIGRDGDGIVTYTNFVSVIVDDGTETKYTMRFDSNGGSTVKAIRGKSGMAVQAPEAPYREGYTFSGWYEDRDLTQEYGFETMPEEDITLYAKWDIIKCKITYQDYDGTVIKSEVVDYGAAGTPPEAPRREGYTFEKWSGEAAKVTEDITVTAVYTKNILTPEVTAPTAKELTYTGEAQELINAGSTMGGTIQYSLDGTNYSTDIPMGTNAGTYTVYYRVVGDDNYSDWSAENPVEVVVKKAGQPGNAPSTTINAEDQYTKVGDIPLPEGWEWKETDRDIDLVRGETVTAVAVYNGADRTNYENENATITIDGGVLPSRRNGDTE